MKRGREEEEFNRKDIQRFINACCYGDVKQVQDFIRRGIDVNLKNELQRTALHYAAYKGHVDIAKVLIQNGAEVNAVHIKKWTPLHYAVVYGHVEIAEMLLQNGADVNAVNKYNQTPLHKAACNGHVDFAKVLIQNGADVNAVDTDNETALFRAASNGHHVFVLQLPCFGATIDEEAVEVDNTHLLGPINDRMNLLRAGKRPETSLMSNEERHFMWNLAFSLTIQHRAAAFKTYYTIRSFITFHGIFMACGYGLGDESLWNRRH